MASWEPERHKIGATHFLVAVGFMGACLVAAGFLLWRGAA